MAVAAGGSLWQDIPTQCPQALTHRQAAPRHEPTHTVRVAPESLLDRIWGLSMTNTSPTFDLGVNSFHHQAVRDYGTILNVIARSADGMIEALTAPDATFALGVQWHPEEMADSDPRQMALFAALVRAAGET
jgi:putative glutamine amidotransferase